MNPKDASLRLVSRLGRMLVAERPLPAAPAQIVVLKPCCLGDVVLATPALAALRRRYPQAAIDVAVGSWSRAALENNPHIRQLVDSGRVGQGRYSPADVWQLARRLRHRRYDLAVTLDRSAVVGLIPWLAGIPHRLGLDSFGRGFAHTVRVPVPRAPRHEALIYLDGLVSGAQPADFLPRFFPSPADHAALPSLPAPFVILHPAGGVNPGMQMLNKRWPAERFAALADRFHRRGFHVLLTGVAADRPLCRRIASLVAGRSPQILAGRLSLGQFGALCRQAALFVGGDTGAMHVAVAAGCKTVAIFGPTDPRRYGPFAPPDRAAVVWRPVPLPEGGVGQGTATGFRWEEGASVEEVWAACCALLD